SPNATAYEEIPSVPHGHRSGVGPWNPLQAGYSESESRSAPLVSSSVYLPGPCDPWRNGRIRGTTRTDALKNQQARLNEAASRSAFCSLGTGTQAERRSPCARTV